MLDPQGEAVHGSLRKLGFHVGSVRVGRLIDVELEALDPASAREQVERMCSELLANPLIESVDIQLVDAGPGSHGGPDDGHDTAPDRHPPSPSRLTSLHDE
jgi:phosphoribosylformylglycinamidine synthase PurS subunit